MNSSQRSLQRVESCPVCQGRPAAVRRVVRAGKVAACGACGAWYRIPRPSSEELAKIYDQKYYRPWGLDEDEEISRITKRATFAPLLRLARELIPKRQEALRVLDVGAATGMLLEMAAASGAEVYAVEPNPYSAGIIRQRLGTDRVYEGDLNACDFPHQSFDLITMTDVIEHLPDVHRTLQTAAVLLRPGGVLMITTPRIDSLSRMLMGANWLHFKVEHIQYFSSRAVRLALQKAGFTKVRISGHSKSLTFDYLHKQLQTYPHWMLTPALNVVGRFLKPTARRRPISYRCGEMLVLASQKNTDRQYPGCCFTR